MPKRMLAVCALIASFTGHIQAQELEVPWRLRVMDLQHRVKLDATIRLTREPAAESCMAGKWKRAVVEANTSHDENFFPLTEPLAYHVERGVLVLGRTGICDDYLFLTGKLASPEIRGSFNAVSIGMRTRLGYFSLKKIE